jgi:hypothetical protein
LGKKKNRLTTTKPQNHFALIFFKVCIQMEPTRAVPTVVITPSSDACGGR